MAAHRDGDVFHAQRQAPTIRSRQIATRGLQQGDFEEVGRILAIALTPEFESRADELAERVGAIVERYPLYEQLAATAQV